MHFIVTNNTEKFTNSIMSSHEYHETQSTNNQRFLFTNNQRFLVTNNQQTHEYLFTNKQVNNKYLFNHVHKL